jgi:RNA polymerase sigma-70 factor (ECF subfamily)
MQYGFTPDKKPPANISWRAATLPAERACGRTIGGWSCLEAIVALPICYSTLTVIKMMALIHQAIEVDRASLRKDVLVMPEDRDELLMVRAGVGDLAAFEELVRRNQSAAWSLAFHYLSDPAEAEDIVQEAFLRLLKSAVHYRPAAAFRTYFSRIVVRLCLDFRSKKRPVYCESLPESAGIEQNPEVFLRIKETAHELRLALADLPPTQRMAFLLRHLEAFTYFEIAQAMNISVKAVDSLLQRGRRTLQ